MTILERFHQNVPDLWLWRAMRLVADVYSAVGQEAYQRFSRYERANYLAVTRRQEIEKRLREMSESFAPNVVSSVHTDPRGGAWHHTVIGFNGQVKLTPNRAPHADFVLEPCYFRDDFAKSNQLWLPNFDNEAQEASLAVSDGSSLSALLLHGRDPSSPAKLGFMFVRFPTPDQTGYLPEFVDCFGRFADLAAQIRAATIELNTVAEHVTEYIAASEHAEEDVGELPDINFTEEGDVE